MNIANYYYNSKDRTGSRAQSYWVARELYRSEESNGECIRKAAFILQHEDWNSWEDKISGVLCGTREYITACEEKLATGLYDVSYGVIVRNKKAPSKDTVL
jgi:hypothetical protein